MLRSFTETRLREAFIVFLLLRLVHISDKRSLKESLHCAQRGENAPQLNHKQCLQSLNVKNRSSGTTPNNHLSLRWKMPTGLHGSHSVVGEVMSFYDILQTFILHIFKDNLSIFPSSFGNWKLWKLPYKQPNLSNKLPDSAVASMVSQHCMAISIVCFTTSQYTAGKKHYET